MSVEPNLLRIVLNGEPREVARGTSVAMLLATLGIDPRRAAVERNRQIVKKAAYAETQLEEADRIEVVTLVGGG